jgi:hypothetical protein
MATAVSGQAMACAFSYSVRASVGLRSTYRYTSPRLINAQNPV